MSGNQRTPAWAAAVAACLVIGAGAPLQASAAQRAYAGPASKDPAAAPTGAYAMDPNHTSVVFRILHEGTSYSTFRFYKTSGSLDWNAAEPERSKITASVEIGSLATPVAGFVQRLAREDYFNAAKFSDARFVSTSIRRTGPTTGEITGDLTILGVTKPVVLRTELVGIGPNALGVRTIGFTGVARIKRSDFGMTTLIPEVGDEVELQIDTEFNRQE